jgi:hypothetical protein
MVGFHIHILEKLVVCRSITPRLDPASECADAERLNCCTVASPAANLGNFAAYSIGPNDPRLAWPRLCSAREQHSGEGEAMPKFDRAAVMSRSRPIDSRSGLGREAMGHGPCSRRDGVCAKGRAAGRISTEGLVAIGVLD